MTPRPMLSIVIPTLNEEKEIGRSLDRLSGGLRGMPHEIIVSDGGSSDRTAEIARERGAIVATDPERIRGIARGRNVGARAASGEFIVFLDADTSIPDADRFFGRAFDRFGKNPRLAGLAVPLRVRPEDETLGDRICFALVNAVHFLQNNVLRTGSASGEFQMVRTSAFRAVGGYREDLVASEDCDLFHRLARVGETRMETSLVALHSGRRAHAIGWPKLLATWIGNWLSWFFLNRSMSKEWTEVR